jgi:hypothetical protein
LIACLEAWLGAWSPLLALTVALVALRQLVLRPRLGHVGSPVPGLASLRALLDEEGRFRGVPVREEADDRFGGGRYVRWDDGAEIRLGPRMLDRADVDALVILEHERGHAARDLAAPRLYRLAVLGTFAFGLAIALGQPGVAAIGTPLMWVAYALALSHLLRDEAAASAYALDQVGQREWPFSLWWEALVRLGVGLGIYLADWAMIAVVVALLTGVLSCR